MRVNLVLDSVYLLSSLWSDLPDPRICSSVPDTGPRAAREAAWNGFPARSGAVTAFVDVNVVPMDTERVLANQTVLVEGGRITALGPVRKVRIPVGAVRINGRGKYLLPGLADMHLHMDEIAQDSVSMERLLGQFVANGVTTVRNMDYARPTSRNLRFKARVAAGELVGPHIYTSGRWGPAQYINFNYEGHDKNLPPPRLDSVAAYVAAYQAAGYDHIKPYFEVRVVFDSLLVAARRLGIPVAGHVPWAANDTSNKMEAALASGVYRSIEHFSGYYSAQGILSGAPVTEDEAKLPARGAAAVRAGVWNTPTLARSRAVFNQYANQLRNNPEMNINDVLKTQEAKKRAFQALHKAGAGLLLGTDATVFEIGWGPVPSTVHHELAALVQAGLTPYEALLTGTRNPAQYFGLLDSSGTVAVGKRADLVLLAGNPLQDIGHTWEPAGVMRGGRWLPRAALDRLLTAPLGTPQPSESGASLQWFFFQAFQSLPSLLSAEQSSARKSPRAQLKVLADSLAHASAAQAGGRQRLQQRMAEQFGVLRAILLPEQRASFDVAARIWLRQQAERGDRVAIPGVAAVP